MITKNRYTMQLQNGRGLINETRILLDLWQPGMSPSALRQSALDSGQFPNISARRLRNIVNDCFAPRYLSDGGAPAVHLKLLKPYLSIREFSQFLFAFTCRAHLILADFIREIYWPRYASGCTDVSNIDAKNFVKRIVHATVTSNDWSEKTMSRAASDLTACCAEFGLLDKVGKSRRTILPFRITSKLAAYIAHDLHLAGHSDNGLIDHPDWALFGLSRHDTIAELKRLALMDFLIVQSAGNFVRITWKFRTMEQLCDVLIEN